MTDLVTGGHGFLGRHLVRLLRARGRPVRVLDVRQADPPAEGVETVVGSVTDPADVARALRGCERVFHLAAIPELWAQDPKIFDQVNRRGTETVLRIAKTAGEVHTFVYCSSEVVLIPQALAEVPARLNEAAEFPPNALCGAYARSKRTGELAALDSADADFRTVVAIPTVPLGPEDPSRTPPTRMVADIVAGRMPAYPKVTFDAVDVRDAALGHLLAAEHGTSGRRYLLSGHSVALGELVRGLAEAAGAKPARTALPPWVAEAFARLDTGLARITGRRPSAPLDGVRIARRMRPCDNARARQELGFAPRPLKETLEAAATWVRDHPE